MQIYNGFGRVLFPCKSCGNPVTIVRYWVKFNATFIVTFTIMGIAELVISLVDEYSNAIYPRIFMNLVVVFFCFYQICMSFQYKKIVFGRVDSIMAKMYFALSLINAFQLALNNFCYVCFKVADLIVKQPTALKIWFYFGLNVDFTVFNIVQAIMVFNISLKLKSKFKRTIKTEGKYI